MVYTVGYQSITLDDFAHIVELIRADRIIDVRSVPHSRKRGFSRKALIERFGELYIWKGDVLGGRSDIRSQAIEWLREQEGVTLLLCMELHPCDCHRYYEIGLRLREHGVEALHFLEGRAVTTTKLKEICDERDARKKGDSGTGAQLGFPKS
jgi:uncharacterized protein (DUF488 family)